MAGPFRTADGVAVRFVANPALAPSTPDVLHVRPDDESDEPGSTWRVRVLNYNETMSVENPWGLLSAHRLYSPPAYAELVTRFGPDRVFILSAGWGLIRSTFL